MVPQAKSASHLKYGMKLSKNVCGGIPDERSRAASFKSERGNKLDFSVEEREIKSAAEQSSHVHATRLHAVWNLLSETVVMLTRVCTSYTTDLRPGAVTESCCVMPSGFKVVLIRFRPFLVMSWTAKERKEINLSSVFLQCLYLWNQTADIWLLLTQPRDICTSIVGRLLVE